MKDDESIQDMHTRFTSIINELHSLCEVIPRNKLVRKILSILPSSWESKVNVITEAKDLQELTIDELVGNLKTYEMKRKIDSERREPKKEKNMVLKSESNDSSEKDSDMAYLPKRFQKMVRKNRGILKRGNSSRPKNYDLCHKCGKPGHFIKDSKRNSVPDKHFKRKRSTANVVKQGLTTWGDFSSESEEETDAGDSSMMAVESEENEYDSMFALMSQSDDDENDDNNEERDDLVVVVVDYKETIENFSKEKETLVKRVTEIEEERDDLLIVIADLREIIEGLGTESRPGNSEKGKEVAKAITAIYVNSGGNKQGIGFQREKTPYNPHSKYVTVPNNWLCTHCGNNGHFKKNCQARVQSIQKNKVFAEKGIVKGSSQ
ncbi:uncharacterized protein [Nicotiana sylvestris]|uniref:uncharacterized protein n=1 Tax=Nicotiana sylvestris TaxID=4096 RepID=UPI00388C93CE